MYPTGMPVITLGYDNHLSNNERSKITAARQHFAEIDVPYAAPVRSLARALIAVGSGSYETLSSPQA